MYDQSERSECPEWDPLTPDILDDQRRAYENLRGRCAVAHSDLLGWSVLRHADVLDVLVDHGTYGNHVSLHVSVPNGMDPPEHTPYRGLIEPYFAPDPMARFEPVCETVATELVASTLRGRPIGRWVPVGSGAARRPLPTVRLIRAGRRDQRPW